MKKKLALAFAAATLLVGGPLAVASSLQDKAPAKAEAKADTADQAVIDAQLPSYPLDTCPLSGEKLGDGAQNVVKDGRLVRTCCGKCAKKVHEDPSAAFAMIDRGVIAQQGKRYPLATCPISGEELGEDAVDTVIGTKLVRTCCKRCVAPIQKDSTAAMAKVDAAWIKAGMKTYKLDVCPVSGEKLGSMGDPIDYLYGTRLVRFCCKGCVKEIKKDPASVLAKLDAAAAAK